jgi:hypothetical protein
MTRLDDTFLFLHLDSADNPSARRSLALLRVLPIWRWLELEHASGFPLWCSWCCLLVLVTMQHRWKHTQWGAPCAVEVLPVMKSSLGRA